MCSDIYLRKAIKWHRRVGNEADPFVKFAVEYIAFEALLRWLSQCIDHYRGKTKTRDLIQKVKQDNRVERNFLNKISNVDLTEVIEELKNEPLENLSHSSDMWWDCREDKVRQCKYDASQDGKLRNDKDFINMVEFIYRARNNMFHGHKDPTMKRDEFIIYNENS